MNESEAQYRLGLQYFKSGDENLVWAMGMLLKSQKEGVDGIIKKQLANPESKVREPVMDVLDGIVVDSQRQYQLGIEFLYSTHQDVQLWAISMLVKSKDQQWRENHAGLLTDKTASVVYNAVSDALYEVEDMRSTDRYIYHEQIGHYEETIDDGSWYRERIRIWVVDENDYWEKVDR